MDKQTPSVSENSPDEKLSPREIALLDLQREELKGKFELDKQRAANKGTWVGAAIGGIGAIALALIPYALNPRPMPKPTEDIVAQKLADARKAFDAKIEEWEKYSESVDKALAEANKRIEVANANAAKAPIISFGTFSFTSESGRNCEDAVAKVALDLGIERVRSTNGFIGRSGDTTVLISCSAKAAVAAGRNGDRVQNLMRQIREELS